MTDRPQLGDAARVRSGPPRVWLLMGDRAGDNSQILGLGEALGWPYEIKHLTYRRAERLINLPFLTTLAGVVRKASSPLRPPWPDLIITAGRRNEPVARWIQQQSEGPVRLVHVGRPWAPIECFDLVITTPQYELPDLPRVLHNETPLHRVTAARLADQAAKWAPRVSHLPRPYVAVLAGGSSGPYPFDPASGTRLGREANAMAEAAGGSLLITTSARTPSNTTDALFSEVRCPSHLFRWTADATENPYFGFLGLADSVIVTADSVSMMAEACATERPVYLFDTGESAHSMRADLALPSGWRSPWKAHLKAVVYRLTMQLGPRRLTRDIRIVQQRLIASGHVRWLGSGPPEHSTPPLRDMERAVSRVRSLCTPNARTAEESLELGSPACDPDAA